MISHNNQLLSAQWAKNSMSFTLWSNALNLNIIIINPTAYVLFSFPFNWSLFSSLSLLAHHHHYYQNQSTSFFKAQHTRHASMLLSCFQRVYPYHSYLNRYTIILLFRGGRGKRGGRGGGGEGGAWPTTNFLGMYCYFPVIRLVNFVDVASVRVVTQCLNCRASFQAPHLND